MSGTRRRAGVLAPHVERYHDWLLQRGYAPASVTRSLTALGHLGRWMDREAIEPGALDDAAVRAFVSSQARTPAGRLPLASVRPFLQFLRVEGLVGPEVHGEVNELAQLIEDYRQWLLIDRGLATETVRGRVPPRRS